MAIAPFKQLQVAYEDIERTVVKGEIVDIETIDAKTQKAIVGQVDEEYNVCFPHTESKRSQMLSRLKLYNNQRRDQSAVGDPLMFSVFNTIHASLYDDRLMVNWEGRGGEDDEEIEDNLNALSEYDYDVMEKYKIDYFWNWDAEFFGRSLLLMMDFDRSPSIMAPCPELIDPTTWLRDPRAASVNGDMRGRGSMRFGGYESGSTYYELKDSPGYFNLGSLKKDKEIKSLLDAARSARASAQNTEDFPQKEESLSKYNNYEFNLLNWFTTIKGQKYLITLANRRSVIVRLVKLDYSKRWPIIDRTLYPMAHDWDGVSIPDLTEDKQRMRAVLLNLGLSSAKADAMPRYLFDKTRIKNTNELNYRSHKYIGVDGKTDGAMVPVEKSTVHQYVNVIMDILDQASQRATATNEVQQGVPSSEQKTLGELQMVSSKTEARYSMSAKVFGWSEKEFWQQWYRQYKKHFKDEIDEKIVRIQGPLAPTWRPLTRENIISSIDPDIKIESKVMSDIKRIRQLQSFSSFATIAMGDPNNNRRYIQKKLAKLNGLKRDEIEMMFPKTVDEIQAEDENDVLNLEKLPPISINDDHQTHINIHQKANQTPFSVAHIRAHKKLMITKRNRPELFAPAVAPSLPGQSAGKESMMPQGAEKVAPMPSMSNQ